VTVPAGPLDGVGEALRLLRRHWRRAYLAALVATLVNTVPDVVRQLLVWDDPRFGSAVLVDVIGFGTGLLAQLWVTGAVAALPADGGLAPAGALRRGAALAWRAVRTAPGAVLTGVVVGGGVSALLTVPPSIAALGADRVIGPLDDPGAGAFAVAALSDVVARGATRPGRAVGVVRGAPGRHPATRGLTAPGPGQ
jgi:hypothetical protein